MAKERDYKHEAETAKARGETILTIKVSKPLAEDFRTKCAANETNKNAVLKRYIERYTYEEFDQ